MPPGPDQFAIIPVLPGQPRNNALLTGPMDLLMSVLPDTRARAETIIQIADVTEQLEEREAEQAIVRAGNVALLSDGALIPIIRNLRLWICATYPSKYGMPNISFR